MRRGDYKLTEHPALQLGVFGLVPVILTLYVLNHDRTAGIAALDFRHDFYVAGHRLLHDGDPYDWTRSQVAAGISFPYPAPAALLFAPFALLSATAAGAVFTAVCIAAAPAALYVLGVCDRRLYGLVLLFEPVVTGWQTANVSLLMCLGIAGIWRSRDRPAIAGTLLALLVSVKPVIAPVALWLLASNRYRAVAWTLLAGAVLSGLGWAVVGFGAMSRWLHLLSVQGDLLHRKGYGIIALVVHLGLPRGAGTAIWIVAVVSLAGVALVKGFQGSERTCFALAVALTVAVSPQVDSHYLVVMLVPLALARSRLSWEWAAWLLLWACPAAEASAPQQWIWWAVAIAITARSITARRTPGARATGPATA